ncbi:MAG: hypothetical protein AAGG07_14245 [Planctomycetota bacterium]
MPCVAGAVRDHVEWSRFVYQSREWMNIRSALAKLVSLADELSAPSIRAALYELERDESLSVSYRRSCWARWRRFVNWASEWGLVEGQLVVEISTFRPRFAACSSTRTRATPSLDLVLDEMPQLSAVDRDLVKLLLLTAARPSEILNLTNGAICACNS